MKNSPIQRRQLVTPTAYERARVARERARSVIWHRAGRATGRARRLAGPVTRRLKRLWGWVVRLWLRFEAWLVLLWSRARGSHGED